MSERRRPPTTRSVSLAQYALLPLSFDAETGADPHAAGDSPAGDGGRSGGSSSSFGTLRPSGLFSADADGDGAVELLVGG